MESLHPISYDAFIALRDSFNFYLYHVFIWFGVNVHNFFEIQELENNKFTTTLDRLDNNRNSRPESQLEKEKYKQLQQQYKIMQFAQKKYIHY